MGKKIKLSFVNDSEPFMVPHMTVKKQEELLDDMTQIEKTMKPTDPKYNREVNKHMVKRVLQTIDPGIDIEDINNMHPDDYIELFNMIWSGGRELGDAANFRQQKKKK